jgi:hypothetical protein
VPIHPTSAEEVVLVGGRGGRHGRTPGRPRGVALAAFGAIAFSGKAIIVKLGCATAWMPPRCSACAC